MSINRCFFSRANVDGILAREVWREARGITIPVRPLDDILAGLRQTD
jgi:hypothetical protein